MFRPYVHLLIAIVLTASLALATVITLARRPPAGTAIVYYQFQPGRGRYLMYHDPFRGLRVQQNSPVHDEALSFREGTHSPDGQYYIVPRPTSHGVDLFVVERDRSLRPLTHFSDFPPIEHEFKSTRSNSYPVWSPDGVWVAFISTDFKANMDIFIIQPDGTQLRRVARDVGTPVPLNLRWTHIRSFDFSGSWLILSIATLMIRLWLVVASRDWDILG